MSDLAIDCRHIHKTFIRSTVPVNLLQERVLTWHKRSKKLCIEALHDISVQARKGEWIGIYGANGSGKTTLLKIMGDLLKPDSGTVRMQGVVSSFFELGIGFHPDRRADENIYLHGLLQGMSAGEIRRSTAAIIDFAGVGSHADLPVKCFSTGMLMRLAFAAAAQVEADIYLFDEIMAVGDVEFQKKCLEHFFALKRKGKTVVIVSHNCDDLKKHCDSIVYLQKGRVTDQKKTIGA